jgi:opacity protein-like surface antigen
MKLSKTLGALLLATGLTTGAQAADYSAPYSPSFDWEGFYAGVGVSGAFYNTNRRFAEVDGILGVNFMAAADWLLGAEVFAGLARNDLNATSGVVGGEVRAGYLVAPEALMYVSGGGVHYFNGATTFGTVGGGVEFAVASDISLDLEYKFQFNGGGVNGHQVGASVLWHF